jgi:hypothetical protein
MLGILSRFQATLPGAQAVTILQNGSPPGLLDYRFDTSTSQAAYVAIPGAAKIDGAISAIMNILLDAQGNSHVAIRAEQGTARVGTGAGNDHISLDVHRVGSVSAGGGNDTITIQTYASGYGVADGYGAYRPAVGWVDGGAGNDKISVASHGLVDMTDGGGGDDTISITSGASDNGPFGYAVARTDGGSGNDTISIASDAHVDVTEGGAGDDKIKILARRVSRTFGDDGDDTISITSGSLSGAGSDGPYRHAVARTEGGAGNDTIEITAGNADLSSGSVGFVPNGYVDVTQGGAGDDTIEIMARRVSRTFGDDGDDTIEILAREVTRTSGGDGDDTIRVTADVASNIKGGDGADFIEATAASVGWIWGGKGDDTLVLNSTSGPMTTVGFHTGDGHDVVTTNAALGITRGADRTLDMSKATFERVSDDTLIVSFEGAGDSITVHLTGDMVGKALAVDHYGGTALVIRRNDSEAPPIPQWGMIDDGVVLTPTSTEI